MSKHNGRECKIYGSALSCCSDQFSLKNDHGDNDNWHKSKVRSATEFNGSADQLAVAGGLFGRCAPDLFDHYCIGHQLAAAILVPDWPDIGRPGRLVNDSANRVAVSRRVQLAKLRDQS